MQDFVCGLLRVVADYRFWQLLLTVAAAAAAFYAATWRRAALDQARDERVQIQRAQSIAVALRAEADAIAMYADLAVNHVDVLAAQIDKKTGRVQDDPAAKQFIATRLVLPDRPSVGVSIGELGLLADELCSEAMRFFHGLRQLRIRLTNYPGPIDRQRIDWIKGAIAREADLARSLSKKLRDFADREPA